MASGQNFFYQDNPGAAIGQALGTAIFGDPQLRAKQQQLQAEMELRRAQAEEARARGGLYTEQAGGVRQANAAGQQLPSLLAAMQPQPAAPMIEAAPDGSNFASAFDSSVGPQAHAETPEAATRRGLPALLAAMGQMQGDKIDPRQVMGTYGAFMGGDELARRGMVAQGNTPGENFALTPQRADAISARDAGEDYTKSVAVARTNHATDIPVANIQAGASRYGSDKRLEAVQYGVDNRSGGGQTRGMRNNNPGNLEYGDFARSLGATGSDGRFAIFPSYEAGVKAQEALLGGRNYLGGGVNTIGAIVNRYAPPGENPTGDYVGYVSRVTGIPANQALTAADIPRVAEAMRRFESGGGTGAILKNDKAIKDAAPAAPKPVSVSAADRKMIGDAVDYFTVANGRQFAPDLRQILIERATTRFQQSGNPEQAVRETMADHDVRRNNWKQQQQPKPSGGWGKAKVVG